jgi:hypothetical protein
MKAPESFRHYRSSPELAASPMMLSSHARRDS